MATSFAGSCPQLVGTTSSIGFIQDLDTHMVVCTPEGRSFLIEHTTSYFLLGFRPKDNGEAFLHKEGLMPSLVDNAAVIAFTTIDGLAGLILIEHCLRRINTLASKSIIRHMRDEQCVWAGVQDEPPVKEGVVVEIRKPGTHVWERVKKNPLHVTLEKVKVAEKEPVKPAPASAQAEQQWSPGDAVSPTETDGKKDNDDVVKTRRRETPKAPRPKKTVESNADVAA